LEQIGQLFTSMKVSEIVMSDETIAALHIDRGVKDRVRAATGPAVDLLSIPISSEELELNVLNAATDKLIVERLDRWGVVVLQRLLPTKLCTSLASDLHAHIAHPDYPFGGIMEATFRKDYPLPIEVGSGAVPFLEQTVGVLKGVLAAAVGVDAKLVELSGLVSYPGSGEQTFHGDAHMDSYVALRFAECPHLVIGSHARTLFGLTVAASAVCY
jgi:hypothetical protein